MNLIRKCINNSLKDCWLAEESKKFRFSLFVFLADGGFGKTFMFTAKNSEVQLVFRVEWVIK